MAKTTVKARGLELGLTAYDKAYMMDTVTHEGMSWYDWHWVDWLKRKTGNDRLVGLVFSGTGPKDPDRFGLGVWVFSPDEAVTPVVRELRAFTGRPNRLWPEGLLAPVVLLQTLRPHEEVVREMRKMRAEAEYAKRKTLLDEKDLRMEYAKGLRKRGYHGWAASMESGMEPLAINEDLKAQMAETQRLSRTTSVDTVGLEVPTGV